MKNIINLIFFLFFFFKRT